MVKMTKLEAKAMEAIHGCCGKKLKDIDLYMFRWLTKAQLKKAAATGRLP